MKKVFGAEGMVTPDCTHSHITYSFYIPEPAPEVCIRFVYDPKVLTDEDQAKALIQESMQKYGYAEAEAGGDSWKKYTPLKNLLTLSVDDPVRHRGAAHRHDPQQEHRLGLTAASPGFLAAPNPAGIWRVTISLHAVVTESLNYRVEIEAGWPKEGEAHDEMDSVRAAHSHLS